MAKKITKTPSTIKSKPIGGGVTGRLKPKSK